MLILLWCQFVPEFFCNTFKLDAASRYRQISHRLSAQVQQNLTWQTCRVQVSQTSHIGLNWVIHTESGWQQEDTFVEHPMNTRQIWRTEREKMAQSLNINLYYILTGTTDTLHPLKNLEL